MGTWTTDSQGKRVYNASGDSKGRDLDKDALVAGKVGTTAGANLGAKEKKSGTPMPKQNAGESPSAYSARLRKWREGGANAQADALDKAYK